jgi:hypothetical protein
MQRRDLLKLLMSTTGLAAVPVDLLMALRQAKGESNTPSAQRTLNAHQDATVSLLSELIIPETNTPGAKAAKVNEFMDLLLTEWFAEADRTLFLQGLTQVDEESRKQFGAHFVDCKSSQQATLMKQLDDAAMEFGRTHKDSPLTQTKQQPVNFFYTFKRLTLVGYYTSEIGFKKELHKTIIPADHKGCAPTSEARS